ncbi:MAG TPA: MFS transporter [Myxococcaceae bacterium]|nr:MFS transporter [Myxococcaceae bacterium]
MARESSTPVDPSVAATTRVALPPTVLALGLVSLLTDASSEMIFALLPAFLAANVPNAPVVLGAMEGLADLVSATLKYFSGRWSDRAARLKPMVFAGYGLSTLARPLMAFVFQWWHPLVVRALDRVGKGIRSTPRDAIIAHSVPDGARGRAYGFHRGMDHAGAALGAGLAALLAFAGLTVPQIFLASAIPGVLAVAAIALAKEPKREAPLSKAGLLEPVPRRLFAYLVPVTVFGMANATDAFLLLRLAEQGAPAALLPMAWLVLHVVKAGVSFPAGWVADRLGPSRVVLAGWGLYALSYVALAYSPSVGFTLGTIAFYGLYHAFSEGAEKALLTTLAPKAARGRALGLYNGMVGVSSLSAGLAFGALWTWKGSHTAFLAAAFVALFAVVLLAVLLPLARDRQPAANGG